jgi:oligopeptide/dipeptide ABC transporter ATP-binding protein
VTSLAILGILPRAGRVTNGSANFEGRDLIGLPDDELRRIRGKEIAMIFQDPMTSLNPVLTIGRQLREALETHFDLDKDEAERRSAELLDRVGIPSAKSRIRDYPHQFSGGMRQRAMIAMALACEPKLLIADEPTTALDVTIQAQILDLLRELVAERDTALILITHDLGVVAGMCERVNVMYAGLFMETGSAVQVFARPRHPYTLGLLQSVPRLDAARKTALQPIEGNPRDMLYPPQACPFAPRCRYEVEQSRKEVPPLEQIESGHSVACFNPVPVEEWQQTRESTIAR